MPELSEPGSNIFNTVLSNIDGIPLPPAVKKSLWKSVGRLVTGAVDVPVAWLEAKSLKIKTEAEALALITKSASTAAAKEFGQDPALIVRTVNHFGSKLLREQINREKTVQLALDDLKANPPSEDSNKEIDSDWLEMFSRIAETKSNEEVQLFLSKILAGEIRSPGTFSAKTIQTLSILDQETAKFFQSLCNISFGGPQFPDALTWVITEPFGVAGDNALAELGLSYPHLTQLQDAGLLQHDLQIWRDVDPRILEIPFTIGNQICRFKRTSTTSPIMLQVEGINFTKVGLELRKVIQMTSNPLYHEKFQFWVINKFNLDQINPT